MRRQRNALALVGLLATVALAAENIVVGGDGSGATWQEAAAAAPVDTVKPNLESSAPVTR